MKLVKVSSKKNSIVGSLVLAEVLAYDSFDVQLLKAAIMERCRSELMREAVPGLIRFVNDLEINSAGKLVRRSESGT